jgi:hypothetical protein
MGEIKIWERERVKNTGRALAFCAGNGTPYPWEGAKIDKQTLQGTYRTQEFPPSTWFQWRDFHEKHSSRDGVKIT